MSSAVPVLRSHAGNEAAGWERAARVAWDQSGPFSSIKVENLLGGKDYLKGPAAAAAVAPGGDCKGPSSKEGDGVLVLLGARRGIFGC